MFDGADQASANARIEFRPLPAQPTVRDAVAFQALFGGLLVSLVATEHPVVTMDWERARENFYAAARDGLDADLVWTTANGTDTTDHEVLFDELFEHASDGLRRRGFDDSTIEQYLGPLRERVDRGVTPAAWKREQIRSELAAGSGFTEAVYAMQATYVDQQERTLLQGTFLDWLDS